MKGFSSSRFDLNVSTDTKRVLVLASSYRCGSTFVSTSLWETGLCGAPWEYFNYENVVEVLKARLGVTETDEYIKALLKVRTTKNGVFSVKAHFYHFNEVWNRSEQWRSLRDKMHFVYINRNNKVAQAVSMAKAIQDNAWSALMEPRHVPLFYSKDLIERCLQEVMVQTESWWEWFSEHSIEPYVVEYDDFVRDQPSGVEKILAWLGIQGSGVERIALPMLERQGGELNLEWERRFLGDMGANRS
ncbi:Stf0 family sulfotransferase [Rhizobium leguminosarum]|uniref:Stf0 family sulfotransferase n=1 Tax=Rhizobium leguminosarum TaxID=384 RepID=UPI003F96CE27